MQVKFITTGANSAFGAFSTGDVLRCSPKLAKHLVEEVKCAEYTGAKPAAHGTNGTISGDGSGVRLPPLTDPASERTVAGVAATPQKRTVKKGR